MDRPLSQALRVALFAVWACLLIHVPALAQQPPSPATQKAASGNTFSQQDLDELLAPIALYPDALLAQILMASTYPLEVVSAERWANANPTVRDKALEDAMQAQPWDPSVKALASVPQVLTMMADRLYWTHKLGDAFLSQQDDCLKTVQGLRAKADAAGNLKSSKEMTVRKETQDNVEVIVIEQPAEEVVYVPTYDPESAYGTWWYPVPPPYYWYPPGYVQHPGLWFAAGIIVGRAIWGNVTWGGGGGHVNIDVNKYNNFNKASLSNGNWNHNAEHRQGVVYRDSGTAQTYNRGASPQAVQSREAFRGRHSGALSSAAMGRPSAGGRSGAGASVSPRQGGGFSGAERGGASERAASARGGVSRAGGGARGGGGRR